MRAERRDVEHYEYVLTLSPLEAEHLHFLLRSRVGLGDADMYGPMDEALRAACPDALGRFW
jgi:hypothetical protein